MATIQEMSEAKRKNADWIERSVWSLMMVSHPHRWMEVREDRRLRRPKLTLCLDGINGIVELNRPRQSPSAFWALWAYHYYIMEYGTEADSAFVAIDKMRNQGIKVTRKVLAAAKSLARKSMELEEPKNPFTKQWVTRK